MYFNFQSETEQATSKKMQLSNMEQKYYRSIKTSKKYNSLRPDAFLPCLPEPATKYVAEWFNSNPVKLYVKSDRITKYGDYRKAIQGHSARITINEGLNPYEFLLTLVHEMAHHGISDQGWYILKRSTLSRMMAKSPGPRPHGAEWQANYKKLMAPLLTGEVFPEDLLCVLKQYFRKPRATMKGDYQLVMALKKYDDPDGSEFVEHLPENSIFHLPDGRSFIKKEKLRKRYRCHSLDSKKIYLFSPIARVYSGHPPQKPKI